MRTGFLVAFVLLTLLLPVAVGVWQEVPGQEIPNKQSADRAPQSARTKSVAAKTPPPITKQQELEATKFVTEHHEELLEVLIHLKEGLPKEYERAIRDLSRARDRLAQIEKRDEKRYSLELKLWQAESRRQLLHARLQMSRDDKLVKQLRETLLEEHRLNLAILKSERERFASRVEKLDEQIQKLEEAEKELVDRKLATLEKASKNVERKVKSNTPKTSSTSKDPT